MQATVETISNLERRMTVSVPVKPLQEEVDQRINRLSRTAKLAGFRPGKVPLKIVQQQYGQQVRDEVFSNAVEKSFGDAVEQNNLKVAGFPNIEHKPFVESAEAFEYVAVFEVFPEVKLGSLAEVTINRPVLEVSDADVKKTIDVLVKQRVTFEPVKRASKAGDKVNVALRAFIDDQEVESTGEAGINLVIGEGGRVEAFDDALVGVKAASEKTFEITYPEDHQPEQLAGKTVKYEVKVQSVEQPKLPKVDADFAKSLGVEDGDLDKMQSEIKASLTQEVEKKIKASVKEQVFSALVETTSLDLPKTIVGAEINRLAQIAQQNLQQRGVDLSTVKFEPEMFEAQAVRNASLRLILTEIVNTNSLHANPDQIRQMVNVFSQGFEHPEDVVRWYYDDPKRLDEPAALSTEENVVAWVLDNCKVTDNKVKFDEFMRNV